MEVSSRIPHKKLFRYFTSNSLLSSSFYQSSKALVCSTGSQSDCSFDSNPLEKKQSLDNSSCGFSSSFNFESNPIHKKISFCNSSSGLPSSFHLFHTSSDSWKSFGLLNCNSRYIRSVSSSFGVQRPNDGSFFRYFSVSSSGCSVLSDESRETWRIFDENKESSGIFDEFDMKRTRMRGQGVHLSPKKNLRIIEIIKSDEDDMESKLTLVASKLSLEAIAEIFQFLNCQRISGLRFFRWVRGSNPSLAMSAEFCSHIVNNSGWLDDYDAMFSLLKEFSAKQICLSEPAFGFLPVFGCSQALVTSKVREIIDLLNEVRGSCRSSGIYALIEMFCKLDMFEMAREVIEMTGKKDSSYNILVRHRCRRGQFQEVIGIIREMTEFGCKPTVKTYNYLLGSLHKNDNMIEADRLLDEMVRVGILPDAITFEILIENCCKRRKVDVAKQLLDKMINDSVEPRFQTHAVFLKTLLKEKRYGEAHNYVIDMSIKCKSSTSRIYSLLADLYQRKGQFMTAQGIISEMMDKGHAPDFQVYIKIVKNLQKSGQGFLASDLQNRYSSFRPES